MKKYRIEYWQKESDHIYNTECMKKQVKQMKKNKHHRDIKVFQVETTETEKEITNYINNNK